MSNGQKWVLILGGSAVLAVMVWLFTSGKRASQSVPPLAAKLRTTKSNAEANATTAKAILKNRRNRKAESVTGRQLYGDLKAELDGVITYLQTGVNARSLKESDKPAIELRLNEVSKKYGAFLQWVDALEKKKIGVSDDGMKEAIQELGQWLKLLKEQDDAIVKAIWTDLENCRMLAWDQVGPIRSENDE